MKFVKTRKKMRARKRKNDPARKRRAKIRQEFAEECLSARLNRPYWPDVQALFNTVYNKPFDLLPDDYLESQSKS